MRINPDARGAAVHRILSAAAVAMLLVSLVGCAAFSPAPAPTETPLAQDDGVPAAAAGTPRDPAIAATCAAVSALGTILFNARPDHDAGKISDEQYAAVIDSAATGFLSIPMAGPTQRGLTPEIHAINDYFAQSPDSASNAWFDYNSFYELVIPVRESCVTNLSELVTLSTSGG